MVRLSKLVRWLRHRGAAIAFVFLALCAGVAINHAASVTAKKDAHSAAVIVYQSQISSCLRGNSLRAEINRRVGTFANEKSILREFLDSAAAARRANFAANHAPSDEKAAVQYANLSLRVSRLHYDRSPEVNCYKVIRKP